MELIFASRDSIKIKTKLATFIVDPSEKSDGDILVFTSFTSKPYDREKVVIEGPGEYEISGVYIKGEVVEGGILYEFINDAKKIIVTPSENLKNLDAEGCSAAVVHSTTKLEEKDLETLSSDLVVVYGDSQNIAVAEQSLKKVDKVNLKKIDELKGFIVYLTK